MKNITRLIGLLVVLVGLAMATGVAYAAQCDQQYVDGLTGYVQDTTPQSGARSGVVDDGEVVIIGFVTGITTDTLVLSDTVIAITPETVFVDEVAVGDKVRVVAYYADDGTLTALKVSVCDSDGVREYIKLSGVVTAITTDTLTLSDTVVAINANTVIIGVIDVGDLVNVQAYTAEDGTLTASMIVQIRGCWDGETGSRGESGACQHGDERTPPGSGSVYQGDNGQGGAGDDDKGNGGAPDDGQEPGKKQKGK